MRILVLFIAILLLPLRGWLGDGMAMEMAQQQIAAAATHEAQGAHAGHAMHDMAAVDDSTMAMDDMSPHDHAAASTSTPDCQSTCTHCQLCHSVAMTVWPALPTTGKATRAAPSFEPMAFASAEPVPGFKPPIS